MRGVAGGFNRSMRSFHHTPTSLYKTAPHPTLSRKNIYPNTKKVLTFPESSIK